MVLIRVILTKYYKNLKFNLSLDIFKVHYQNNILVKCNNRISNILTLHRENTTNVP